MARRAEAEELGGVDDGFVVHIVVTAVALEHPGEPEGSVGSRGSTSAFQAKQR